MALNKAHVLALLAKEVQQIRADKSVLLVAFILPLLLVLLYGSGLRLDVKPVRVALVSSQMDDVISKEIAFALAGSEYFTLRQVNNANDAGELLYRHEIDAYVLLPSNLAQSIYHRDIQVQIVINGSSAPLANLARNYLEALIQSSVTLKGLSRQVSYLTYSPSINLSLMQNNTYQSPLSTSNAPMGAATATGAAAGATNSGAIATHDNNDASLSSTALAGSSLDSAAAATAAAAEALLSASSARGYKNIEVENRNWFNESNESTWYMMAGQLIGTITMMAAFMSAIVIAREFERGTLLGLKATHVSAGEVLLSKFIVYYALSCLGASLAILFALIFYQLPFRGSVLLYILSTMVYLYVIVMMAFVISAATQSQFLSSQYCIILSFLPSILLSGAVFDLRSIPEIIGYIAHLLPPTYAVSSSKICILSGGNVDILLRNTLILLCFGLLFHFCAYKLLQKQFTRTLENSNIAKKASLAAKEQEGKL